ncbi:MAG: hypothetical protein Q9199_001145 [Rusavskia elegans]
MAPIGSDNDKGATGAAKFVTSTVGNTVGGLGRTVGGVVGAGGRGLGQTITAATGGAGKPVGEAIESLGNGVENGAQNVSKELSSNPQTSSEHGCAIFNHIHPSPWPLRSLVLSRIILNIGALGRGGAWDNFQLLRSGGLLHTFNRRKQSMN